MFIRNHADQEWFRLIGPGFDAEGLLCGVDDHGAITVETSATAEPGQNVCLVNSELYAAGFVGYCVGVDSANFVSVHLDQPERRRHARYSATAAARLRFLDAPLADDLDVQIVDVSENGLGLISEQPAKVGSHIELTVDYGLVFAQVRHCGILLNQTFRIGVEIQTTIFKAKRSS